MKVLLTNDDGIEADGLQALRRALVEIPDVELAVIAPDGNRSAMARSITTRRPLWVQEVDFGDGTSGFATDGTPVDCVRLARLGLVDGFEAQLIVSGINHGSNLGDDITYSGTVAAALEGVVLGLPAVAVSQQSAERGRLDFLDRAGELGAWGLRPRPPRFVARRSSTEIDEVPMAPGTLLNVNCPRRRGPGRRGHCRLGKRIYRDQLDAGRRAGRGAQALPHLRGQARATTTRRARTSRRVAAGTDRRHPAALRPDRHQAGIEALGGFDLEALVRPAAREV